MKTTNKQAFAKMGNPSWVHNWTLDGLDYYCEIRDDKTGDIWLCQQPITHQEFQSLQLPDGFSKVGIGRAAHDAAYFRRSPDTAEDGLLDTIEVGDRMFVKVARAGKIENQYFKQGYKNFVVLAVHKYHKVMFAAGRSIEILTMDDGKDYVPNTTELRGILGDHLSEKRILPKDWAIRKITLKEDLFVEIPCPARVCFFKSGYGFHGPVELQLND